MVSSAKATLTSIKKCNDNNDVYNNINDNSNVTNGSWQGHNQVALLPSWFVIQLTATASLGGCLFGYDMGAISGTLTQLTNTFDLDDRQKELSVSILYVGGAIGACIGGSLCDRYGRKVTIMLTDIVFILGALLLYFASVYTEVVIGRFIVGIGVAVSGVADVSYLHECSPMEWRGSIVSVNEACISLGFLLAYIAGYVFADEGAEEWRVVFGVAGILAAIQFIGMFALPESPAWLAENGNVEAANRVLERINNKSYSSYINGDRSEGECSRGSGLNSSEPTVPTIRQRNGRNSKYHSNLMTRSGTERVNSHTLHRGDDLGPGDMNTSIFDTRKLPGSKETFDSSREDCASHMRISNNSALSFIYTRYNNLGPQLQTMKLTLLRFRQQIFIAVYLAVTQQFCGQTNILSYAPLIFADAMKRDFGVDKNANDDSDSNGGSEDMSMIIIGLVKFFVTVLVIWRIEYIGRRFLLISGNILIAAGLLALVIAFGGSGNNIGVNDDIEDAATPWSPLTNIDSFSLALPGVLLIVCGYSMSFGPLTWLLTSEIFPTEIRGRALGYTTIVSYICGAISTETFLFSQSVLGPSFVFGVYCVITVAGTLFAYMAIPDTGGKTVEQIDDSLNQMHWWKYNTIALSQNTEDSINYEPASSSRSEMVRNHSELSMHNLT